MMNGEILAGFMRKALELADKGRFLTYPNPATGAVLVRDGMIVAQGWHRKAGEPHAEINCLRNAREQGIDPAGALMVVTLEPCKHYGKTPPCVDALLKAGIGGLAYGASDPNPEARGGAQKLANAGITVFGPILESECKDLISDFTIWQTAHRPYVIIKLASTLDGRIATRNGQSRWISAESSRKTVHEFRALVGRFGGAILVGANTFRQDNPVLTSRLDTSEKIRQPLACVLLSRLPKMDLSINLLRERPGDTVFFTSRQEAGSENAGLLRKLGCAVQAIPFSQDGEADLGRMLEILREEFGCPYVYCEGGGTLALALLKAGLADELHLHIAPMILGDDAAKALFSGNILEDLQNALRLRFCSSLLKGTDLHIVLRPENKD